MDEEAPAATTWADIKGTKMYYTVFVVQYLFHRNSTTQTTEKPKNELPAHFLYKTQNSDIGLQQRYRAKLMDEVIPGNHNIRMTLINQETYLLFPMTVNEQQFSG